mmetsp:Transcript_74322/g.166734  ORF Transcript_74322/g.166734 Transcript_74322/m.166734 type:complete len:81 (+) Transcript_74322:2-244(+)
MQQDSEELEREWRQVEADRRLLEEKEAKLREQSDLVSRLRVEASNPRTNRGLCACICPADKKVEARGPEQDDDGLAHHGR